METKLSDGNIRGIINIFKHSQSRSSLGIPFPHLDRDNVKIVVFTDRSFENTEDLSSQIVFIIFLQDESGMANFLDYSSRNSRGIVRLVLGRDIFAFSYAVDVAVLIRYDLKRTQTNRWICRY